MPKRSDKPLMGLQSGKDFLVENVKEAAAAAPKYREERQVGSGRFSGGSVTRSPGGSCAAQR